MSSKNKFSYFSWVRKSLVINGCVFTLIVSPMPIVNNDAVAATEAAIYAGKGLNVLKNAGQMYLQQKQQSFAQVAQAQQMASLQPKSVPDKFFGCPLPEAVSAFPNGACKMPLSGDPAQISEYSNYLTLGTSYVDLYTKMSTPGNSKFPIGLQCVEEARKEVASGAQARMNQLTKISSQIEKNNQMFRDQNKKLLQDMQDINYELHGDSGGKNSKDNSKSKTKDLSTLFNLACKDSLRNTVGDIQGALQSGGLLGLRQGMQDTNQSASRYMSQAASYERDLNKHIQKVKADIQKRGVDAWLAKKELTSQIGGTKFAAANMAADNKAIEFTTERDTLLESISEFKKFGVDQYTSPGEASDIFKKKYVHDCVTLNDRGVGIPLDKIYGSVRHGSKGVGNIEKNFSISLRNIMENGEMTLDEKMDEIAKLQGQYGSGSLSIEYYDPNRNIKTDTPYNLFKNIVAQCEGSFDRSESTKLNDLKKTLTDIQQLENDFANEVVSAIDDQIRNCGGNEYKTNDCSNKSFDPGSPAFCMSHASTCANQVNSCFNSIKAQVQQRQNNLEQKALNYNNNVEAFVAQQDAYLNQVRDMLQGQGEILRRMFPGGDFNIPEDLFVKMPEMDDSEYGVNLRGGGDLRFIKELPRKLADLKDEMMAQQEKIDGEIQKYIAEQRTNITTNMNKWKKLAADCEKQINDFNMGMMKAAADGKKEYDKQAGKAGKFCSRYDRLKDLNPAAGCDEVNELFTESFEITAFINPEVAHNINQYKSHCAQIQSEKENGSELEDDDTPYLVKACEENGQDWDKVRDNMVKTAISQLPPELSKYKSRVKSYMRGESDDLPDKVEELWGSNAKKVRQVYTASPEFGERKSSGKSADERLAEAVNKIKTDLSTTLQTVSADEAEVKALYAAYGADKSDTASYVADLKAKLNNLENIDQSKFSGNDDSAKSAARNKLLHAVRTAASSLNPNDFKDRSPTGNSDLTPDENLCEFVNQESKYVAESICTERASEGSNESKCDSVDDKAEELLTSKDDFKKLTESNKISRKMRSIASITRQIDSDEVKWTTIGQQDTQTCMAQNSGQRDSGNWLDEFDRMVLNGADGETSVGR